VAAGAIAFVRAHREPLSHIPTAYFLVSGLLRDDTPEMRAKLLAFLDPVRAILEPSSIGLFAGKIDFSKRMTQGGEHRHAPAFVRKAWRYPGVDNTGCLPEALKVSS